MFLGVAKAEAQSEQADALIQLDSGKGTDGRHLRGQLFAGMGAWISDCAPPLDVTTPAMTLGGGLSTFLGGRWDFLFRATVQLGLSGCGARPVFTSAGFFGPTSTLTGPPPGAFTAGLTASPLFRLHVLGGSPSWVLDIGPTAGVLWTAGTNGRTNTLALVQATLETGVVFGDRNQFEILLQLPFGFALNRDTNMLNNQGNPDPNNDDGFVFTPMLLLVYAF